MRIAAALAALLLSGSAAGQEPGWQYSPLPDEGDRAAMGCAHGSTPDAFACLVVRCEDDASVGLHIHTSRAGSDAGRWLLDIDKDSFDLEASVDGSPYKARVQGEVGAIIEHLKQGIVAYLDPLEGPPVVSSGIRLAGSLYAINEALYFCAAEPQLQEIE